MEVDVLRSGVTQVRDELARRSEGLASGGFVDGSRAVHHSPTVDLVASVAFEADH